VQDRYAGDVGDFLKIGLLRQLVGSDDALPDLRLGVVWYLAPDEGHNADGKHVRYLDPNTRAGSTLRQLDPDLYERLARVVAEGRSVRSLEHAGVLPAGSRTFAEQLSFDDVVPPDRDSRLRHRRDWLRRATSAVDGCDLVFVDPDNGLRKGDHSTPRHRTKAVKHAYYDELRAFTDHGQSIVAYHHADRSAAVEVQAVRRMTDAADELQLEPLAAVRASRGTTRLFLVVPQPEHRKRLAQRLGSIRDGRWGSELSVIWWKDETASP
jgi:hypothetical protein